MFDLMKLPPELRVKIYEYALVRDVIRIVSTVHPLEALHPKRDKEVETYYEDRNPKKSMRLRSTREHAKDIKYVWGKQVADRVLWSYGIQPSNNPPLVNIFLMNRKVYSEAWPIFYEQNAFAFAIPTNTFLSIEACIRFLYDRPYHALRHIREMHLLIGNAPHLPIRSVLSYDPWQHLIDEISRYLSVRVLVLYIRGRTDDAPSYDSSDYPWRDWLYKMNGLRKLEIDIANESTHEANVALVKQMRSKMVLGGEQMEMKGITVGQRPPQYTEWTVDDELINTLSTSAEILDLEENY
ncbi:MAG: hypothetical protein ASARMPREDX12_001161 [Alectoria sarmentosa]|nr:MAG: hypothetical protein ASARMPREDX12_001161 [Alectoria sarmentosa]